MNAIASGALRRGRVSPNLASKGVADSLLWSAGAGLGMRMSGLKPTEWALEGFRITRENPRAFGAWVVVSVGVSVLAAIIDVFLPASVKHGLDTISGDA